MGCNVDYVPDVGVAGLYRLLGQLDRVREADVVIVAAGMDGALPSVVAGIALRISVVSHEIGRKMLTAILAYCRAC